MKRVKVWYQTLVDFVKQEQLNREHIIVVLHPASLRAILCLALDLDLDKAMNMRVDSGHVWALDYLLATESWELRCGNCPMFF